MSTTTSTVTHQPSSQLTSSVASLSSSQHLPSHISPTYKQASHLFLTRRIQEAYETLLPLITPPTRSSEHADDATDAPIASASRALRVKVWSLYTSILNEAIELGADAGKKELGPKLFKKLAAKARDGSVWDDVVNSGYQGAEGNVDADVVANLQVIPMQVATSERLETYLSAAGAVLPHPNPNLEANPQSDLVKLHESNTLRELNARLRVLEIYTLHVLPANEEWDYAKDFVEMNDTLDNEKKDVFLQTLQSLQDEKNHDAKREEELQKQREQQLDDARRHDEEQETARQAQAKKTDQEERKRKESRPASEKGKSAEKAPPKAQTNASTSSKPSNQVASTTSTKVPAVAKPPSKPAKKAKPPPTTLFKRASLTLASIQNAILAMGQSLRSNPMALLRTLLFTIALVVALARRDVRDRITRTKDTVLAKAKATVGMGMKVSYI